MTGLALVAGLMVAAALAAGAVDRAPVSFPILFLGLGFALGPGALGVLEVDLDAPVVEVVAVVTLSLVLFLDAVRLDIAQLRRDWVVPALTLGPGTLLTIGGVAVLAVTVAGFGWPAALVAGAALASTDAVTLRDVLRDRRLPASIRRALAVEAGTNDIIVLPLLLLGIALAAGTATGVGGWLLLALQLFVASPVVGAAVGAGGALLMGAIDRRTPVRTEYQSIYGVGLVLTAAVAGEAVGGSGFVAAFAAGLAVSLSNAPLCDCFLDLGQVLVEVLLLAAFVLFGALLGGLVPQAPLVAGLVIALCLILVVRPLSVGGVLVVRRSQLSGAARAVIGWFGPRGLASMLLALLAVQGGVPGGEVIFALVGVVVTVSVVVHGTTIGLVAAAYQRRHGDTVDPEDRDDSTAVLGPERDEVPRVDADTLAAGTLGDVVVIDARSGPGRRQQPETIAGSRWIPPERIESSAASLADASVVVTWCTCVADASAARSAARLRARGVDARALRGGLDAARAAGMAITALPAEQPDPA